jgi:tape measure domain-containing protein
MNNLELAIQLKLNDQDLAGKLKVDEAAVRKFGESFKGIEVQATGTSAAIERSQKSLASLSGALAGAFAGVSFARIAEGALDATKAFDRQSRALANLTGSAAAAQQQIDALRDLAERLGQKTQPLTDAWVGFAAAVKGSAAEGETARAIFAGVVAEMSRLGADSSRTSGVLFQLSQALNKGKLQLEDLNVIAENGLPIIQLLAQAYDKSKEEIFDLINKGLLPADEALRKVFATMDDGSRSESLSGNINRLSDSWDRLLLTIGETGKFKEIIGYLEEINRRWGLILDQQSKVKPGELDGGAISQGFLSEKAKTIAELQNRIGFVRGQGDTAQPGLLQKLEQQMAVLQEEMRSLTAPLRPLDTTPATAGQGPDARLTRAYGPAEDISAEDKAIFRARIIEKARAAGVDPALALGIVENESSFNPGAIGYDAQGRPQGRGLFQTVPSTFKQFGSGNFFVPDDNINAGINYLADLQRRFGPNPYDQLKEYRGLGAPGVTQQVYDAYFKKIAGSAAKFGSSYDTTGLDANKSALDAEAKAAEERAALIDDAYKKIVDEEKKAAEERVQIVDEAYTKIKAQDAARADYEQGLRDTQTRADETNAELQQQALARAYQQQLISADDYYANLLAMQDDALARKLQAIDAETAAEQRKLDGLERDSAAYYQSLARLAQLGSQRSQAAARGQAQRAQTETEARNPASQTVYADNLGGEISQFADQFGERLGNMSQVAFTAAQNMQTAFAGFFSSGLRGTENLGDAFKLMIQNMVGQILAMMAMQAVMNFVKLLGGAVGGALGGGTSALTVAGATVNGVITTPNALPAVGSVGAPAAELAVSRLAEVGSAARSATAGVSSSPAAASALASSSNGGTYNISIPVDASGTAAGADTDKAAALAKDLHAVVDQRIQFHQRPRGLLSRG